MMGLGTFAGVDTEQKWSRITGFIGNTRRMTKGNRQLAIAMKFENEDRKKLFGMPLLLEQTLDSVMESIAQGRATERNRGTYADAFERNLQSRKSMVAESSNSQKAVLRLQIEHHARLVRSMERKVKSGTKITSVLRHQLTGIRRIKDLLIRFNSPSEEIQD